MIHDLRDGTRKTIAQTAADSVEDNDLIVNRVTRDGEDRCHHDQGKLATAESKNSESNDEVVGQGGERAHRERRAEPHAHVNENANQAESQSERAVSGQLFSNERTHVV